MHGAEQRGDRAERVQNPQGPSRKIGHFAIPS
jgi:hypothetical protein